MFIIDTYPVAVLFCLVTMLCWGSWANAQKLASSSWRFELFYWDYVFGIVLFMLIFALTFGSNGDHGRPFTEDLQQGSNENLVSAFAGGIIFNFANILLTAAITIAGMSVAFPVGIGLALIIGVLLNYLAAPTGNVVTLFLGVGCIAIAIALNAYSYSQKANAARKTSTKGLLLSVLSGCTMGLFYKYVAASMATNFVQPETAQLTPYTALFIFSLGILVSNIFLNTFLMRYPLTGERVRISEYFTGSWRDHAAGIIGGCIWSLGMSFSILASEKAGPAISYGLGQGATVVAALWGIYVWKEFTGVSATVQLWLRLMLLLYVTGLGLIIISR